MYKIALSVGVFALVVGAAYWFLTGGTGQDLAPDSYGYGAPTPQNFGEVPQQNQPQAAATTNQATNQPNQKIMHATLHTNQGDITIEFLDAQAPNTVANFVKLASAGFYDGTKFHRVIKGFMIQGGDPLSKDDSMMARWGTGGPGYQFADEISASNHNDVGTISMANAGPNTNGSQFFINTAPNNFLDGKHTVFGKVVAGMDVVTKIENTPTGANDRPDSPMVINSITLE
jgi:peptidylprolyl isomerase